MGLKSLEPSSGTKLHPFQRHSGKNAALGPPKLPEGRRPEGSFGGPRAAFLPEGRGKGCNFNIINQWNWFQSPLQAGRAAFWVVHLQKHMEEF